MQTLDEVKAMAQRMANYAAANKLPSDMEVVKLARKTVDGEIYEAQPFGLHEIFKTHMFICKVSANLGTLYPPTSKEHSK